MRSLEDFTEAEKAILSRILAKVTINLTTGCWDSSYCVGQGGYTRIGVCGKTKATHRVMCQLFYGDPPVDKPFALHGCDRPVCTNPIHLRWGSAKDNAQDVKDRERRVLVTHCPEGHLYEESNIYWDKGNRRCKTCCKVRLQEKYCLDLEFRMKTISNVLNYYANNQAKILEYKKKYRLENLEKFKLKDKLYHEKCGDARRRVARDYHHRVKNERSPEDKIKFNEHRRELHRRREEKKKAAKAAK